MDGLKDALKSACLVWLFTTIGLWIPGLLGWINEVTKWADQKGAPPFPDPSNLAYLFVAALTAAFPAAVAGIVRFVENASGWKLLPRNAPAPVHQPRDQGGYLHLSLFGTWPVTHNHPAHGPSRDRTLAGKSRIRARRRR